MCLVGRYTLVQSSWPAIVVVIADIVHLTNVNTVPPSFIPPPTIGSGGIMFSGDPSVICPITHFTCSDISDDISMKLATNIVSGKCWKGFQGHKYECGNAIWQK